MKLRMLDFECTKCNKVFEELIDLDTDGDTVCPDCGGPVEQRLGKPAHGKHVSWSQWRADLAK